MADTPTYVRPQEHGLSVTLADGRKFRAFPATEGKAICYVLEAVDGSHTHIGLTDEALTAMVHLWQELRTRGVAGPGHQTFSHQPPISEKGGK